MRIPVRRLAPALPLPAAQHQGDAGYDSGPGSPSSCPPVADGLPSPPASPSPSRPLAGLVLPRSGLALRHGVTCLNAPA